MSPRRRLAIALAGAAALSATVTGVWVLRGPAEPPRMMRVGGQENPCTCTQRIEP